MRIYVLIHDDVFADVDSRLRQETGEMVEVPRRDPIYETRDVLDDDGNPTGETYEVFIGYDEVYFIEIPEVQGGYCSLGKYDVYQYMLLTGKNSTFVDLERDHESNFVIMMKWPDLETFQDRAETRMATPIRANVNAWRASYDLAEYPSTILNGEALQDMLNLIRDDVDIIQYTILASED